MFFSIEIACIGLGHQKADNFAYTLLWLKNQKTLTEDSHAPYTMSEQFTQTKHYQMLMLPIIASFSRRFRSFCHKYAVENSNRKPHVYCLNVQIYFSGHNKTFSA